MDFDAGDNDITGAAFATLIYVLREIAHDGQQTVAGLGTWPIRARRETLVDLKNPTLGDREPVNERSEPLPVKTGPTFIPAGKSGAFLDLIRHRVRADPAQTIFWLVAGENLHSRWVRGTPGSPGQEKCGQRQAASRSNDQPQYVP